MSQPTPFGGFLGKTNPLGAIAGLGTSLFGSTQEQAQDVTKTGERREKLIVDEEAVSRLVEEMLSGTQGLAGIFQEENVAGVFGSSVAAQASGNLLAKVAGEIAKLKSEKVTTEETETKATTTTEDKGLLDQVFGGLF